MTKIVLAFGSFDIVHPGHLSYLEKAKKLGDKLIVVVARDSSIEKFKKRVPVFTEKERLRIIGSLKPVDMAVLGNKLSKGTDIFAIFKKYKPDVIALGYDQRADTKELGKRLEEYGIGARVVRINVEREEKTQKSSKLRRFALR